MLPPLQRNVHITHTGAAVGMQDTGIYARYDGKQLMRTPLAQAKAIFLYGVGSVSGPLVRQCLDKDIPLIFCSSQGTMQSVLKKESIKWYENLKKHHQYIDSLQPQQKVYIAKCFLICKIENYIPWLKQHKKLDSTHLLNMTHHILQSIANTDNLQSLLGFEGSLARVYFRHINEMVIPKEFHSAKREARLRHDPWNALLDTVSSWLFTRIHTLIHAEGLNPYAGFLHQQHTRYATLVADIQEIFRYRTERWIVSMVNQNIIRPEHFILEEGKWNLTKDGRKNALSFFERELFVCQSGGIGSFQSTIEQQICFLRQWLCQNQEARFLRQGQWWTPLRQDCANRLK